jgi:glucose dehydrogenase
MTPRLLVAFALLVAALLVSVSLVVAPLSLVFAGQTGPESTSWPFMNSNPDANNFVQQGQITEQNAGSLTLKWIFPFPAAAPVPGLSITGAGVIAPPIVVNGTVYMVTNFLWVYAINAATGGVLWTWEDQLNTTGLPLGPLDGHIHGINYYMGDVWVSMPDCSAYGLNAATGEVAVKVSDICAGIPGNSGRYAAAQVPPTFYKDTMIWSSSVSEGTDVGRGFVAAYNISGNQSTLLWRWYVTPGAGGDPNWDFDSCPPPCHGNVAPVSGDWGAMGYQNLTRAGAGPSFGDPVVDSSLGIVFVSTSQPSPDWNGTYRPGPDLYADSIIALNATNGKMLWFYQTTPHDLYDFDCGWNTVLGSVTVGGVAHAAVFKACKNGYVYALDALTGSLLWYFSPPSLIRSDTSNANYVVTGNYSADLPWINYPSTAQFTQCPGEEGGIESDIAVAYGMVYVAAHNFCTYGKVSGVGTLGPNVWGVQYLTPDSATANTTIYAINASTGKEVWSFFIPNVPYRGWLTASGGMVFAGSLDGDLYMLDAKTGKMVQSQYFGTSLYESPTFGATDAGQVYLFQLTGAVVYGAFNEPIPGALMAFAPSSSGPPPALEAVELIALVALVACAVIVVAGERPWRRY